MIWPYNSRACRTQFTFPWVTDMSNAATAGPSKTVAVTALGLITVLLGGVYAALGGIVIYTGAAALKKLQDDPAGGFGFLLRFLAGFVAVIGVALLVQGVFGILAGLGVLGRSQWGRVLTFIWSVLVILGGLASLAFSDQGATYLAAGAVQLLYGALAFVILIKKRAEFTRRSQV